MEGKQKPVLLSGVQPSGDLMIGNYFGAIRNWIALQDDYDCLFPLVDLHAITVRQGPEALRRRSLDIVALYIACGVDPQETTVFIQSHVPAHAEMAWLLDCFAYVGELSSMAQYKDKARRHARNVNAGLLAYPVLMAADILLHQTDLVPVGDDQRQHLELTRTLARRFNQLYGPIFTVPERYTPQVGDRIMSLTDATRKMSKSDEDRDGSIFLLDSADEVRRKVMQAVTDSGATIAHGESRPAISNLVTLYSCAAGLSLGAVEERFAGSGYARFKRDLAEALIAVMAPIQERFRSIRGDHTALMNLLAAGAARAAERAAPTLRRAQEAIGLVVQ